jgi:hypothetical protein
MTITPFAVTFTAPIVVYGINFTVACTACPRHGQPPAVLWVEDVKDVGLETAHGMLPVHFWEEVERQLANGGPVRDAYEAELEATSAPAWQVAAE